MVKDGLREIIGKEVVGAVIAENTRSPEQQVFLTFSDGTYFEFWGSSFSCAGGVHDGGHTDIIEYVRHAGGNITAAYGVVAANDEFVQKHTQSEICKTNSLIAQGGIMDTEAAMIRDYVKGRGIDYLIHFTQIDNVPGILDNGVLGRQTLADLGIKFKTNDHYRHDRVPDAICASISFPNYKMFYGLQKNKPEAEWAVLRIDPRVLWEIPCAYCATNAASHEMACLPLEDRMTLKALTTMFADVTSGIQRSSLGIPDAFTTNPQAEVLVLGPIDPSYIISVSVNAKEKIKDLGVMQRLFAPYFGKFKFFHDGGLFTYRKDYDYWRRHQEAPLDSDVDLDKFF